MTICAHGRQYKILQIEGQIGFYVVCEHRGKPDWLRILAWFLSRSRADSYREIEADMDNDGEDVWTDTREAPPIVEDKREPILAMIHAQDMAELEIDRLKKAAAPSSIEDIDEKLKIYSPISQASGTDEAVVLTAREAKVLRSLGWFLGGLADDATADDMPSFNQIAEREGMSRNTVSSAIDGLERKGCVVRSGERGAPIYRIIRDQSNPLVTEPKETEAA